ncbi:MAG: METTL5 family protein [Promethearchaeota archaeon]
MNINKKQLISIIQNTEPFVNPKVELEQYCIDANSAVDIIYFAGFEFNDIRNKFVIDFGSGTGRLSVASALLNAETILSIDIDLLALKTLKMNISKLGLEKVILPFCCDINYLEFSKGTFLKNLEVTTIMNPPFGVKKRAADRIFLEKAFSISNVVYSIHLAGDKVYNFISKFSEKFGWRIDNFFAHRMTLERTFQFHKKKVKTIDVNVYRFIKNRR